MSRKALLILLCLFFVAAPTYAVDAPDPGPGWELLGRSTLLGPDIPGPWEYVDTTRITITGSIRHAWTKSIPAGKRPKDPHRAVAFDLTYSAFNCQDRTREMSMSVTEHLDGTRETSDFLHGREDWGPVVPDSLGEAELDFVCKWSPK